MKKLLSPSLAALAVAALLSATLAQAEIIIGQSAPLTGKNASLGLDIRRGAMAYFNTINASGGIHGQKINLLTLDDMNDPANSVANAKALLDTKNALVLFGFASATLSAPAFPLLKEREVALFAPFTGADLVHSQTTHIYTIRASYREEMRGILNIWQGTYKSIAVVHYDDAVGKQNFDTVAEIIKPTGITPVSIMLKRNTEVSPQSIAQLETLKPQVILFTTLADPIVSIVRKLKQNKGYYNFSSLSFAGPDVLKDALGLDGAGLSIATVVPIYTGTAVPIISEYEKAMTRDGNTKLSYTSLEGYIAAKALSEGIKRAGPNPTRKGLMKSLDGLTKLDVGGYTISFAHNEPHGSKFVNVALVGNNGKFKQ